MLKTDDWATLYKAVIIFLVAFVPSLVGFLVAIKWIIKGWIDAAKEKSVGKEAIEKIETTVKINVELIRKLQIRVEEMQEMEVEISELKKVQDKIRELFETNMMKQMEMLMRGNK